MPKKRTCDYVVKEGSKKQCASCFFAWREDNKQFKLTRGPGIKISKRMPSHRKKTTPKTGKTKLRKQEVTCKFSSDYEITPPARNTRSGCRKRLNMGGTPNIRKLTLKPGQPKSVYVQTDPITVLNLPGNYTTIFILNNLKKMKLMTRKRTIAPEKCKPEVVILDSDSDSEQDTCNKENSDSNNLPKRLCLSPRRSPKKVGSNETKEDLNNNQSLVDSQMESFNRIEVSAMIHTVPVLPEMDNNSTFCMDADFDADLLEIEQMLRNEELADEALATLNQCMDVIEVMKDLKGLCIEDFARLYGITGDHQFEL